MIDTGNTAWIITATALVLFMTLPGLALFYGGLVRKKNVLSVLMQCISVACLASVLWLVIGYSLAFGMAINGLAIPQKCFCQELVEILFQVIFQKQSFLLFK